MIPSTHDPNRPWTLLPLPPPMDYSPSDEYGDDFFYQNVARPLIRDTIRIMGNGLPIDLAKVAELEEVVDNVLTKVTATIESSTTIQEYYKWKYPSLLREHIAEYESKIHTYERYLTSFNSKNLEHRSYYMHHYISSNPTTTFDIIPPVDTVPSGIPRWTVNDVKRILGTHPSLEGLTTHSISDTDPIALSAMKALAQDKADKFNERHDYITRLNRQSVSDIVPRFNPASSNQLHELLTGMLGFESDIFTDAFKDWQREVQRNARYGTPIESEMPKNKFSWPRDEVEKIQYTVPEGSDLHTLLQAFIDHSFAAIIKQNFIEAFYDKTIGNYLYGNLKIFGAKTFRLTSSGPNLLNMPSTGSIYAKPIKECFVAPEGAVIYAIDYGALENRVIASLSGDENLSNIYLQGLDGHCMNSMYYFKEEIEKHMTLTGNTVEDVKEYYRLVESGNKALKAIRQKGKSVSFGMQYGAYPPKVAQSIKCSLQEAEVIFNRYHNELYPSVTKFREGYVAPTAAAEKRIHMGLGAYLYTDSPDKDIRTITNSCSQFWSVLTLLTINEMHYQIDKAGLQDHIKCIATIYDSIYYTITADPEVIKWHNDTIIPIMAQDFITDQKVHNEATGEIGLNWSALEKVPHGASIEDIAAILNMLK